MGVGRSAPYRARLIPLDEYGGNVPGAYLSVKGRPSCYACFFIHREITFRINTLQLEYFEMMNLYPFAVLFRYVSEQDI